MELEQSLIQRQKSLQDCERDYQERILRRLTGIAESIPINVEYMGEQEIELRIREELRRFSERDRNGADVVQGLERHVGQLREELREERNIHRDKVEAMLIQLRETKDQARERESQLQDELLSVQARLQRDNMNLMDKIKQYEDLQMQGVSRVGSPITSRKDLFTQQAFTKPSHHANQFSFNGNQQTLDFSQSLQTIGAIKESFLDVITLLQKHLSPQSTGQTDCFIKSLIKQTPDLDAFLQVSMDFTQLIYGLVGEITTKNVGNQIVQQVLPSPPVESVEEQKLRSVMKKLKRVIQCFKESNNRVGRVDRDLQEVFDFAKYISGFQKNIQITII